MKLAVTLPHQNSVETLANAGADILIVGISGASLRTQTLFKLEDVIALIDRVKTIKKSIWVKLDALFYDVDLPYLTKIIEKLSMKKVDGFIFIDPAVYKIAQSLNMTEKLIYAPTTYLTSYQDESFWQEKNIQGTIISPVVSLEEMLKIAHESQGKTGIIGHGFINMFHSRRRLLESYGNHINQPLSDESAPLYIEEALRDEKYPIIQDQTGTHVFKEKPLASFKVINDIKNLIDWLIVDTYLIAPKDVKSIVADYKAVLMGEDVTGVIKRYENSHDDGFYYRQSVLKKGATS